MAKINRYTQYQPSRYTPQSLQELMVAPQYMRGKHDELETNIAETESALAQIDNSDIHDPLVQAKQKELNDRLAEQVNTLNSEGFNSSNKSNFLRFNKDYQQAMGPKGVFGKAQAAKTALSQEKESYIVNATKMGYDPQAAAANWEDHVQQYRGAFDGKNINNIESLYSPDYIDYKDEFTKLLTSAGVSSTDISNIGSSIVQDEQGNYVLNTKFREKYANNKEQLQNAENYINNQINNPNSRVRKSMDHNRISPEQAISEITGLKGVYKKDEYAREDSSTKTNYSSPTSSGDTKDNKTSPLYFQREEMANKYISEMGYNKASSTIKNLKSTDPSSPDYNTNIKLAREMEESLYNVSTRLENDKNFKEKSSRYDSIKAGIIDKARELGLHEDYISKLEDVNTLESNSWSIYGNTNRIETPIGDIDLSMSGITDSDKQEELVSYIKSREGQLNNLSQYVNSARDKALNGLSEERVSFQVDKRKMNSGKWNQYTQQVVSNITDAGTIGNNYDIDSFYIGHDGDMKILEKGKESDQRAALFSELSKASNAGNASVSKMYIEGNKGLPMVELKYQLGDDPEIGKEGQEATIRVALNDFYKNAKGSNIQNLFISPLEELGGAEGARLANSMRSVAKYTAVQESGEPEDFSQSDLILQHAPKLKNIYKDDKKFNIFRDPVTRNFLVGSKSKSDNKETLGTSRSGMLWGEVINDSDLDNLPEDMNSKLFDKLVYEFSRDNRLSEYDIQEFEPKTLTKKLKEYLKDKKNSPIQFSSKENLLNTFN